MDGPPIKFHIDPEAIPVTMRKPAPVPLHWKDQVEQELNRDVALGVLERVPHGNQQTGVSAWSSRKNMMVVHEGRLTYPL